MSKQFQTFENQFEGERKPHLKVVVSELSNDSCLVVSLTSSALTRYALGTVLTQGNAPYKTSSLSGFASEYWTLVATSDIDDLLSSNGRGYLMPRFHKDAISAVCFGLNDNPSKYREWRHVLFEVIGCPGLGFSLENSF